MLKKGDDFSEYVDGYAARKLKVEFIDLSREQDDNSETITGNVKVTNTTPYYLKSCNITITAYNDKSEQIDTVLGALGVVRIKDHLAPGESTVAPLDGGASDGLYIYYEEGVLNKAKEIRAIDVTCNVDTDKCAEKGADMTVPEELLNN